VTKQDTKPLIQNRGEEFVAHATTRIWQETPVVGNPYIAETCRCHGYEILELAEKCSFTDVIFLLQKGDLPTPEQSKIFEVLLVSLINPGPRHPATRSAMNAGVGKTDPAHILPIAQSVMSGNHLGVAEVSSSMEFLKKNQKSDPFQVAHELLSRGKRPEKGDWHIVPGFGSRFGGIDHVPERTADLLLTLAGKESTLEWANYFARSLHQYKLGWLSTGLAAAVFVDLGFHPRAGAGLYQIACSPGLLAHGLEFANKPRTALPFPDDEHYFYEDINDDK
jgi:citrate synthase